MTCPKVLGTNDLQRHARALDPCSIILQHQHRDNRRGRDFLEYIDCASLANRNSADCNIGKAGRLNATRHPQRPDPGHLQSSHARPKDSVW